MPGLICRERHHCSHPTIYVSQPFGYDLPRLSGILLDPRNNNIRDEITGALICRHDVFVPLIEGPETSVNAALERIDRDDRHLEMKVLVSDNIEKRLFGDWAMLHYPATSLIWTEAELSDGILDCITPDDIKAMFDVLAEKVKHGPPV
jgi:hypothetical protein